MTEVDQVLYICILAIYYHYYLVSESSQCCSVIIIGDDVGGLLHYTVLCIKRFAN